MTSLKVPLPLFRSICAAPRPVRYTSAQPSLSMSPTAAPIPYPVATMPLRSVTSVKWSRPAPDRSLRKRRLRGRASPAGRTAPKRTALHREQIEIAVVVVVEERASRPDHLRQQQLSGRAVDVNEVEPDFGSPVGEGRCGPTRVLRGDCGHAGTGDKHARGVPSGLPTTRLQTSIDSPYQPPSTARAYGLLGGGAMDGVVLGPGHAAGLPRLIAAEVHREPARQVAAVGPATPRRSRPAAT